MEGLAAFAAVVLLLLAFGDSGSGSDPDYTIALNLKRDCYEVKDQSGNVYFEGTKSDCERWIEENR